MPPWSYWRPAFQIALAEAFAPRHPLRRAPPPSCAACPDRAGPFSALLRGTPKGLSCAARGARRQGALGRALPGRWREKVALYFLSVTTLSPNSSLIGTWSG